MKRMKIFLLLTAWIGFNACQPKSKQVAEQTMADDSLAIVPIEDGKVLSGVVEDVSMNNFMLVISEGDTIFISTMDREPDEIGDFELGDTVKVNYIEEEEEPGVRNIPTAQKVTVVGKRNRIE